MSHIQYFRLTHPDAEKDLKGRGPSPEEVRTNLRTHLHVCSACGGSPEPQSSSESTQLKNCAGCRTTRYCSKKCQVSDWPFHKKSCAGSASSTDINLKLSKKLMANDYLMFYITVYAVLSLDLLNNPANAIDTCLVVNVTTKDADPLAALKAVMDKEERGPGSPIMLQVASIDKKPMLTQTTPGMRTSLEKAKAALAGEGLGDWPVVMLVFTGDGINCLGCPCPITPEALKQGRELNPFVIKSSLMGVVKIPVTEKSILEQFNNNIYMDKDNRYLLHTKSK
ncbi:hypothetical protein B0H10DRAFT_292085 [Mycena sp. CBHHK59/15]|nr:hypothetical protein B0H10DRAFT_292085 [Mycena sp. CBHHK59/15]